MGYDESEARILSLLLDNNLMPADALIEESRLSRGKVYQVLKNLEGKGKIRSTNDRPSNYVLADHFVVEVKDSFSKLYETINTKLSKVRPKEDEEVAREVRSVFESLGYSLTDIPNVSTDFYPESYNPRIMFDYLLEDDYRFCVSIIDKTKSRVAHALSDPAGIFWLSMAASQIGCVDYFILVSNFEGSDRLYNSLKNETAKLDRTINVTVPISPIESSERFFGIEGQTPIVARTGENFQEIVQKAIADIRSQRKLVQEQVNKVHSTLGNIERTMLDAEVSAKNIIERTRVGRHAFPVGKDYDEIFHLVAKIREPIQNIVNREKRSLDLVKQDYMRLSLDIEDRISSFSRRVYLPQAETVRRLDEKLVRISVQLEAIGFEIKCLEREVFPRLFSVRPKARRLSSVNPFVFTVPYEPEGSFAIGQDNLRSNFDGFASRVAEGSGTGFRFVIGKEGAGKSHSLHNILIPALEKKGIIPIVVDCPLKQDIVESLLDGILNAPHLPPELQSEVRSIKLQSSFSSLRDLIPVIDQLVTIAITHSYNGLVLVIDEFENSLPRTMNLHAGMLIEPLSLRQLRELLTMDTPHFGLVIASRSATFDNFKNSLRIQNISDFTLQPVPFQVADITQIVQHRYALWKISQPHFSQDVLDVVLKKTSGNPRSVIKYLRELYRYVEYKGSDQVTSEMVDGIGPIPIFVE